MNPGATGTIAGGWSYVYAAYTVYIIVVLGYSAALYLRYRRSSGGSR